MSDRVSLLLDDILEAIDKDKLSLPTLPEVALRVRKVAADPGTNNKALIRVISKDAALSARLVRMANSPLMRRSKQTVTDLNTCVSNLGVEFTSNLAVGIAMSQVYQSKVPAIRDRLHAAWNQSTNIAGLCHVICRFTTNLDPSVALLAGLVHNIGILPVLTFAEEQRELTGDLELLDKAAAQLAPQLGDTILLRWSFRPEVAHVPTEHLNFRRQVSEADYADIVTYSILQDPTAAAYLGDVDRSTVTAYQRLNLGSDREQLNRKDVNDAAEHAAKALR